MESGHRFQFHSIQPSVVDLKCNEALLMIAVLLLKSTPMPRRELLNVGLGGYTDSECVNVLEYGVGPFADHKCISGQDRRNKEQEQQGKNDPAQRTTPIHIMVRRMRHCRSSRLNKPNLNRQLTLSGVYTQNPSSRQPRGIMLGRSNKRDGATAASGWHTLRHTFGTLVKAAGADVATTQSLMRHANVSITMDRYVQAVSDAKREAQSRVVRDVPFPSVPAPVTERVQ
jgi:Phage integrase family